MTVPLPPCWVGCTPRWKIMQSELACLYLFRFFYEVLICINCCVVILAWYPASTYPSFLESFLHSTPRSHSHLHLPVFRAELWLGHWMLRKIETQSLLWSERRHSLKYLWSPENSRRFFLMPPHHSPSPSPVHYSHNLSLVQRFFGSVSLSCKSAHCQTCLTGLTVMLTTCDCFVKFKIVSNRKWMAVNARPD